MSREEPRLSGKVLHLTGTGTGATAVAGNATAGATSCATSTTMLPVLLVATV